MAKNIFDQFDDDNITDGSGNVFDQFEVGGDEAVVVDRESIDVTVEPREPTIAENLIGGLEAGASIASSIVAEPLAGIAGIAQAINPFAEEGAGAEAVDAGRQALTFQPRSEQGQKDLQAVGETLQPAGEFVETVETASGDAGFELGQTLGLGEEGQALMGALATAAPAAVAELLGVAAARPVANIATKVGGKAVQATQKTAQSFNRQSKGKQQIAEILQESPTDVRGFGFELERPKVEEGKIEPIFDAKDQLREIAEVGELRVRRNKPALEAEKQGLERQTIQFIAGSSAADKAKYSKMLAMAKSLRTDKAKAESIRLTDVVGESLSDRVKFVAKVNEDAGKKVDLEARNLEGQQVDFDVVALDFIDDISDNLGVDIVDGKARFLDSTIEDFPGDQKAINDMVKLVSRRLTDPDGKKIHDLKKRIDAQVTFGKQSEGGLSRGTEQALKKLRGNINDTLGAKSPPYAEANKVFSETVGALDELQSIGGKRLDLEGDNVDQHLGILSRRLAGNAVSSVPLKDSINVIEAVARKYGADFDDSLFAQLSFAEDMNSMFRTSPVASLKGELQGVATQAAQMTAQPEAAAIGFLDKGIQKARGINEDNAFKAIQELIDK